MTLNTLTIIQLCTVVIVLFGAALAWFNLRNETKYKARAFLMFMLMMGYLVFYAYIFANESTRTFNEMTAISASQRLYSACLLVAINIMCMTTKTGT